MTVMVAARAPGPIIESRYGSFRYFCPVGVVAPVIDRYLDRLERDLPCHAGRADGRDRTEARDPGRAGRDPGPGSGVYIGHEVLAAAGMAIESSRFATIVPSHLRRRGREGARQAERVAPPSQNG